MTGLVPRRAIGEPPAAAVASHGEAILTRVGVEPSVDAEALAIGILADVDGPFHDRLRAGLGMLLRAVAERRAQLGTAAACRLIGLGPGATPLGDDYLAACALAVARLGGAAGFARPERDAWLRSLLPQRLGKATTPVSAHLIADAVRGFAPPPAHALFELDANEIRLETAIERLAGIGATSGHGWAAAIGATALLLAVDHDKRARGEALR
ncbi:MAG: DUF2877 domain-containing protein [Solirubrobacterales bacterium]|nr:DUF2877 domain-containing protein [Solirubrobacterales bacterium]